MRRDFQMVDVFGSGAFSGNPVAVISGAEGLDTDAMQRITRWLNLSETTFLLPPTDERADYRVRIFTLDRELPFAGHPTLGTCHAWLHAGGKPKEPGRIVQQCATGLVPISRIDGRLSFAAPPLTRSGPIDEGHVERIAAFLRISRSAIVDAQWADNGPGWAGVMLESADAVLAVDPVRSLPERLDVGLIGAYPEGSEIDFEIRTFFSDHNRSIVEDPITGSFNASAAQWLYSSGRIDRDYIAAQGTRIGRQGRVYVSRDSNGVIWVGGETASLFSGTSDF